MKKLTLLAYFFSVFSMAQVGIGTTSPDSSSALDIQSNTTGVLVPRLTTSQRDAIVNPANGLLIYNTDADEFQYNSNSPGTPTWEAVSTTGTSSSTPGQSFKYSNTDTTTDVNPTGGINLPVFGTLEWNDNSTLYSIDATNNSVTIAETGRYRVIVNASLFQNAGARRAPEMFLEVNSSQVGAYASTGYIRDNNGHEESSLHINEVIEVDAGDVISVEIIRAAANNAVTLRSEGSTNIYIEKIL